MFLRIWWRFWGFLTMVIQNIKHVYLVGLWFSKHASFNVCFINYLRNCFRLINLNDPYFSKVMKEMQTGWWYIVSGIGSFSIKGWIIISSPVEVTSGLWKCIRAARAAIAAQSIKLPSWFTTFRSTLTFHT